MTDRGPNKALPAVLLAVGLAVGPVPEATPQAGAAPASIVVPPCPDRHGLLPVPLPTAIPLPGGSSLPVRPGRPSHLPPVVCVPSHGKPTPTPTRTPAPAPTRTPWGPEPGRAPRSPEPQRAPAPRTPAAAPRPVAPTAPSAAPVVPPRALPVARPRTHRERVGPMAQPVRTAALIGILAVFVLTVSIGAIAASRGR